MGAPVLQFKRGQFSNLPGLRAGEPGFTTDKFDLYVGIDSTTSSNKFFGSHRYWNRETATVGSSVRVVEGSNNGSNYIELKSPNSLAQNVTYTLPATDVANGILVSDGSGNLSYTTTVTGSGSGLSAGTVPLSSLDIDGGTDIGAAIVDADEFIVDDGGTGTNRKVDASRIKDYVLGGGQGANFAAIKVTGISTLGFADATQLKVSGVSTFTGAIDANGNLDVAGTATFATPLANSNLANDSVSFGGVSLDLGGSDATPAFNLSDATSYPTSSLVGTITNAQLAGSIANDKLSNNTVSFGGISLALGASDATPAFDLQDATNLPTTSLTGTVTNAQLAGSIANDKLSNSTVSLGGVSIALGGSDATPAFNLSDATSYPTSSLVGTITNAQLAGSIANDKLAGSIANNKLANSTVSYGGVSLALGASDATPAFDLQDATNLPTTSLTGTITNTQLAGSIANGKLANSTVSFGGISLALGASDATPAFDLSDATNYPTTSLTGTITNAQLAGSISNDKLAGSIANGKLANSTVSFGGISLALGASDATPAFDLSDATSYPTSSLVGTITNAQLAGSIVDGKLNTITTANKVGLAALDIDGGTDIGADLVDADLLIVDDGAGGTNRKTAMSRVKNYVLGGGQGATFAAVNVTGISTVAFVDATQLKVSGVSTFTGTLDVNGAIDADGGANIAGGETVLSSATVSDLTDNRVVIAGTSGALEDSANLTFNGSQLGVTGTVNASSTVTGSAFHTGAEGSAIRVTSNTISGPATITLDPAGVGDNTGKVVIAGDFQVDGTTTTVNSTTVTVADKNILVADGAANDAAANGGGITIESGEGNKTFQFEATGDNLGSSENLNVASGKVYKINNVETLSATTLGANVVNSALTNVGTLTALTVSGNASIEGNVDLGNATSDTITATGRFDSDLVPSTDGARDLGSSTLEWKDLYLDGTAHVDTLDVDVNAGIVGDATVGGTLGVTGDATLGADLDVTGTITGNSFSGSGSGLSAGTTPITTLDIDGGTDIGADLVDADLIVVDDGAGGTNRKSAMSRVKNYVLGGGQGATFAAINVSGISTLAFVDSTQLKVSGISTFTGAIDANGGATIDNIQIGVTGNNEIDTASGNLTIDSAGGTVAVDDNLTVSGDATVTGGLVANGNVDLGNATSDTITATGRFDSDLVPSTDGARDLGTSALEWKDLFLDGTAHVDTLDVDANAGIIGDATVGGTLGVTGESTLASATVSDLTSGRVVLAGTAGALEDSGNLTFNGSLLNVTGAVTSSGAVNIDDATQSTSNTTGALIVDGGVGIAKNAHIGGTLDVDGQITSAAPLRNSTGGGLIAGVGIHSASASSGLVTAFKFRGTGLQDFIVEDGIGDVVLTGVAASTFTTQQTTTATEGQTAFTVSANYTNGFVDVYLNGIRLITGVDYTETNSSTVTLASGATAGDEVTTVSWKELGDIIHVQSLKTVSDLSVAGVATATGGFVGDLTGDVSGNADSATVGTTITVADESSDTTCFPLFATAATGNLGAKSGSNLTFNSNTGALSATSFAGSGSGLTAGTTPISTLDIDGATATTTLADADLFIVDDGAGGTNRKVTLETLSDSILGGSSGATFAAINVTGIGTFGGIIDGNGGANISGGAGLVASSAKVSDLTSGRVVLAGTDGEIEDSGNLTFDGSTLGVTGAVTASGTVTANGAFVANGNVDLGNATSDTITATGRFDSDLVPSTDGARDLGSSTLEWMDLHLDGTAHIDTLDVDENAGIDGSLTVGTTLGVSGESTLASAKVSDLTSGRVVLAGTAGAIEDSGNLTFNGSTLAVTGSITASSNVTVTGNLTVNGTTTQINTVNTTIEDTLLELQKVDGGNLGSDTNKDVGIVMNYYDGSAKKAAIFWDDSAGRFALASEATETTGVLGSLTYGGLEVGSLYVNDCAGASQVISCSGTTRSLENITIDGGSF